jgi:hypothetical protein
MVHGEGNVMFPVFDSADQKCNMNQNQHNVERKADALEDISLHEACERSWCCGMLCEV